VFSQNYLISNNNFILRFVVAYVVAFTLLTVNRAIAQAPAGSITDLIGDVRVERVGTIVPATPGMALDVGDRIITGSNSRVTITLTDNSKLELDESTTLVIDEHTFGANMRKTKLSLFSGLVRSFVSYTSSSAPNFDVHTPNAVASARGTEYDTSTGTQPPTATSEEDRKKYKDCHRFTQVSVYEGTVEVTNTTNPSGGSVQVPPGHKTLVACGLAPFPPSEIGAAPAAAGAAGNGLFLGGAAAVGMGGTFAGLAAGGAFGGGGGNTNKKVKSPSE
jgi:ferric-dicitrate binding protein FerR (iron transport regulator)